MPQASTNSTFKPGAFANTGGVDAANGQTLTVEFRTADPTDLTTTFPRIWVNNTTGLLKYTVDGTTVKTVTAT